MKSITRNLLVLATFLGAGIGVSHAQINPDQIGFASLTGCTTPGFSYVPQDKMCESSGVAVSSPASLASVLSLCTNCTVSIASTVTQSAAATVPTGMSLVFNNGGSIACDTGGDTINFQAAGITAPATQVFTGCASGQVENLGGSIDPTWFAPRTSQNGIVFAFAACPNFATFSQMCDILPSPGVYTTPASTVINTTAHSFRLHSTGPKPHLDIAIGGLATVTFNSGITASGTGTCDLLFTNGGNATLPVTAGTVGTTGTITFAGQGAYINPTTATVSSGTATCASSTLAITGWTQPNSQSFLLTFTTATNALVAGEQLPLSGFTGNSTFLNGQTVTIQAGGLTTTQFEAFVQPTGATVATSSGLASVANFTTTLLQPGELLGGVIFTPTLTFSGDNFGDIEIDDIGFDDGPIRQSGNPTNALTVSCTTGLTFPCGHNVKIHDDIGLGNSATASTHGFLVGEGFDNCQLYNNEMYWNSDGLVTKCSSGNIYGNISKGHSTADYFLKGDAYAPMVNMTFDGNVAGVINPGDSGTGINLQGETSPLQNVTASGNAIYGVLVGIGFDGGTTPANNVRNVTVSGTTMTDIQTNGIQANNFVDNIDIPSLTIAQSGPVVNIPVATDPDVTHFHIGHIASDQQSNGVTLNGPTNRMDDVFSVSAEIGIINSPIIPLTLIDSSSTPWVLGKASSSLPGATGTGTIAGTVLTVATVTNGAYSVGQTITGTSVTAGSVITSLGTGTGGVGTYNLNESSTVSTAEAITATQTNGVLIATGGILINSFDITYSVVPTCSTSSGAVFVIDHTTGGRLNTDFAPTASTVAGVANRITVTGGSNLLPINPGDELTVEQAVNAGTCTDGTVGTVDHVVVYGQPY